MNPWHMRKPIFIPSKWTFVIFATISVACFALTLSFLNLPQQISYAKQASSIASQNMAVVSETPLIDSTKNVIDLPVHLIIPKIYVDTELEQVGLTPKGEIGIPNGRLNAAWFLHSVRPGEVGSAIITAHYGFWKDGTATVFNRLDQLNKEDQIFVEDTNGVIRTFVVQKLQSFDAEESVPEVFGSNDEKRRLNLITCEGVWNEKTKSYPKRLIVFAAEE